MAAIEVNVCGSDNAEAVVLLAKESVRKVIAGACGLTNNDQLKVRLSFHPTNTDAGLRQKFKDCYLAMEVTILVGEGVMQPYADQLRDNLVRSIPVLKEFKGSISIPGQRYPYHMAAWSNG